MSFIVKNITSGPPVAVELGDMGITIGIPAAEVTDVTTVADVPRRHRRGPGRGHPAASEANRLLGRPARVALRAA